MIRFLLGMIIVIGALVFLGCPLRMLIRMSAGDANAWVGLIGFAGGIATGSFFLKKGFSLGRAHAVNATNGMVLPIALVFLLCLSMAVPTLFAFSEKGPGSMHAPVLLAFAAAVIIGIVAQKSRMCFAGSLRDIFLMKDFGLISILGGLFVVMLIFNIATGNFKFSFTGQPVAHAQHLWNILGLYVVGFAAVLAGGCPMRQLILAGQGSTDSAVTFLGLLIGAAAAFFLGYRAALKRGGFCDRFTAALTVFTQSVPMFIVSIVIIYALSVRLRMVKFFTGDGKYALVCAVLITAVYSMGGLSRVVREAFREEMKKSYVKFMVSRGFDRRTVLWRHAFKPPLASLISAVITRFAGVFGGSTVLEFAFAIPGLSTMLVTAMDSRDYNILQTYILVVVLWMFLVHVVLHLVLLLLGARRAS